MRRESKKRSLEKGYYKRNPCKEVFTCKVCGRLVTPEGAGSGLSQLPDQPAPGPGARGPGGGLWRNHGASGGVGAQGRRVGPYPPVPPVRGTQLQSGGGGRQPSEAPVHRPGAAGRPSLPSGAHPGDGPAYGRQRQSGIGGRSPLFLKRQNQPLCR